jgi:hypothetical protein
MKLRRSVSTVGVALGILLLFSLVAIVALIVDRSMTAYPTPETQSSFLRKYNPYQAIAPFGDPKFPGSSGGAAGDGAGCGSAKHTRDFDTQLTMQSAKRTELMAALDKDLTSLLTATGAQIVSKTGDDAGGIYLRYVAGKSAGTVTIASPELITNPSAPQYPRLRPGEVAVWVRVRVEETWFKAGVPSQHPAASFMPLPLR